MTTTRAIAIGLLVLLGAAPVWAHHAFSAEFDVSRPIKLQGTLVKWEMINPHSWFHLDVKNPDGLAGGERLFLGGSAANAPGSVTK